MDKNRFISGGYTDPKKHFLFFSAFSHNVIENTQYEIICVINNVTASVFIAVH